MLALPYIREYMLLDTDSCSVQIGCILLQKQPDDTTKPIWYRFRSLAHAEKRQDMAQRECLTIVRADSLLRSCVVVHRLTIHTILDAQK